MTSVEFSGPLFDGSAKRLLQAGVDAAEQQVALAVRDQVRDEAHRRADQWTGVYESRVRVEPVGGDRVVTDSGLVYSDWLAGTAPRNARSTFKGWHHWERVEADMDGSRAVAVAEKALKPFIEKMG